MRYALFLWPLPFLIQCSWKAPTTSVMQVGINEFGKLSTEPTRGRVSKDNPQTLGSMHCFFISVSGTGIVSSEGSERLNSRKPECFGLGTTTKGVKLTDLVSSTGYRFRIPLGPNRQVSVFGAYSSVLGTSCTNREFGDLFGFETRPRVYLLGRTTTDLFRDSAVQVVNSYDSSQADDLAETCAPAPEGKPEPGDPTVPPSLRGARLYVGTVRNNSDANLHTLSFDDQGLITVRDQVYMGGEAKRFRLTNDRTRLVMTYNSFADRALINTRLYRVETQGDSAGSLIYKGLASTGNHAPGNYFDLDPVQPFFYVAAVLGFTSATFSNDQLSYDQQNDVGQNEPANVVSTGKFVYGLSQIQTAFHLDRYVRNATTGVLTSDLQNAYSDLVGSNAPGEMLFNGGKVIYLAIGSALYSISMNPETGNLSALAATLLFPPVATTQQRAVGMYFDTHRNKLYVLTRDLSLAPSGPGSLLVYSLATEGSPGSTPRQISLPGVPVSGAMDPTGRFFFYGTSSKTLFFVDLAEATPAPKNSVAFGTSILEMTSLPVF